MAVEADIPNHGDEDWRDIAGFVGDYQVSRAGSVRSLPRIRQANGAGGIRHWPGVVLRQQVGSRGYYQKCRKTPSL